MLSSLTIATRKSLLALWQAEYVKTRLQMLYPDCLIQLLPVTTEGDRRLDTSLADIGGKGLFIKELEQAIQDGRAHIAVHSIKDVPMHMPEGFILGAILEREDPRDVFISHHYRHPKELPDGAKVGTSSPRRTTQLLHHYPYLQIELLRGNIDTRLRKLKEGTFDAILLAAAGVRRLGLFNEHSCTPLSIEECLPAVGQGAIAIECRAQHPEILDMLAPLHHENTGLCIQAERAFSQGLSGSCHMPIAAHAYLETSSTHHASQTLHLHGYVGHPKHPERVWRNTLYSPLNSSDDANELGWLLSQQCQRETPWLDEILAHNT